MENFTQTLHFLLFFFLILHNPNSFRQPKTTTTTKKEEIMIKLSHHSVIIENIKLFTTSKLINDTLKFCLYIYFFVAAVDYHAINS